MNTFWRTATEEDPVESGWYPVMICWESSEGSFPDAEYWDGNEWKNGKVLLFGERADDYESAQELAWQHDPEI